MPRWWRPSLQILKDIDRRRDLSFSALVTVGYLLLAYSVVLGAEPILHGRNLWVYSGDFFATLRGAHMILWGGYGLLYSSSNGLIAPPLGALSLVPFAEFSALGNFVEPYPYAFANPTIWLYAVAYMGFFVFAWSYSAMRMLRLIIPGERRNRIVVVASTLIAGFILIPWGHPEDLAAVALCLWAFQKVAMGAYRPAGYYAGAALAFQPLAILFLIPLFIIGIRRLTEFVPASVRAALVPLVMMLPAFLAAPSASVDSWFSQPNFPKIDHLTLLGLVAVSKATGVPAGLYRLGMLGIVATGALLMRHRLGKKTLSPRQLLVVCGLGLSVRALFEPVIVPYYLTPFLMLAVLVGVEDRPKWPVELIGIVFFSLGVEEVASIHTSPVNYSVALWLTIGALVALVVSRYSEDVEVPFALQVQGQNETDLPVADAIDGRHSKMSLSELSGSSIDPDARVRDQQEEGTQSDYQIEEKIESRVAEYEIFER